MLKYQIAIISFCILLLNLNSYKFIPERISEQNSIFKIDPSVRYDFKNLRDTFYTLEDYIIEVNLSTQHGKIRSRDGWFKEFPVSSGTDKVEKGVKTNEGLFVIHWKSLKQHSVQFDSTVMLYWMGFNNGIGFHALEGNGYYKYLGKKNVSHGCLRISREDAKEIFNLIGKGTPVMVHSGSSAIYVEFGDYKQIYKYYSYKELKEIIPERFNKIYRGEYLMEHNDKILIDEQNVAHSGLVLGDSARIPKRQLTKPAYLWFDQTLSDNQRIDFLKGNIKSIGLNYTFNTYLDSLLANR